MSKYYECDRCGYREITGDNFYTVLSRQNSLWIVLMPAVSDEIDLCQNCIRELSYLIGRWLNPTPDK